jgi:murein DD-endopeptidase MepM/ murein hydrolase activator NlpD
MLLNSIDWPLDSNVIRRGFLNNTFGPVRKNADGTPRNHQGWDLWAAPGTPCYAIADATVAGVVIGGDYGMVIVLKFDAPPGSATGGMDGEATARPGMEPKATLVGAPQKQPLYAAYCHLSKTMVAKGDVIKRGQVIGLTGRSGNATSMRGADDHLHFEIRTVAFPGRGLDGRISPARIFGTCPLKQPVLRAGGLK